MLRTVLATRYVTPLREGGSLPAIVEADDLGLYVLKFRGAGQGPLALVAEIVAGEIARHLGLKVPELVLVQLDEALGRNEPDYEVRQLLQASVGINMALDYLPGSVMFDAAAGGRVDPGTASATVWFDAFVTNVDRTARNPNLLYWHKVLYLIDHGAALYFHHDWPSAEPAARSPFRMIRDHVLLGSASRIAEADAALRPKLDRDVFEAILANVPDTWLDSGNGADTAAGKRADYVRFLLNRLDSAAVFVEEALRARAAKFV
jgi:hypothetical protein